MTKLKSSYKTYLVGGAVRDELLGLPIKERDWVVVGATPKEMLDQGFRQVGRDFPVFLHPQTHEEYALARTERKVGKGYKGFVCFADPSVTLEEDLKRRDLTINAIAKTKNGRLIDPYHGIDDLNNKVLRHVSAAFSEDPLRILRVARFAARFGNFKVHPTTNKLMHAMLLAGEVAALVPERVWQELERALSEPYPYQFFAILQKCQVLPALFPEIAQRLKTIRPLLIKAAQANLITPIRFALLFYGAAPKAIENFCQRWRVPSVYRELVLLIVKHCKNFNKAKDLTATQLLNLLQQTDAFRRKERFLKFLQVCVFLQGKDGEKISKYLQTAHAKVANLSITHLIKDIPANKIQSTIQQARRKILQQFIRKNAKAQKRLTS